MSSYLAAQEAAGGVSCNVITVPEECGTADALRQVAGQVKSDTLVVYSGDILTDTPLRALVATHQVRASKADGCMCVCSHSSAAWRVWQTQQRALVV